MKRHIFLTVVITALFVFKSNAQHQNLTHNFTLSKAHGPVKPNRASQHTHVKHTGLKTKSKNQEAGLLDGNSYQLLTQPIVVLVTIIFSLVGSFLLYKVTGLLTRGMHVDVEMEINRIDIAYHPERIFS